MYTGKPLPPLPQFVRDKDWAAGFVHVCDQCRLDFGSDRAMPVRARPVVEIRKDGLRAVVLPCTSKDHSKNVDFYALTAPERIMWSTPSGSGRARQSFACRRYETVPDEALQKKIGVMPHPARLDLMAWLKERY